MPRALRLLLLAAMFTELPAAAGGVIIAGYPSKLHMDMGTHISAHVYGFRWTSRDGRTAIQILPRPALMNDLPAISPPPGEWTDVGLLFDGPLALRGLDDGVPFAVTLDLDALAVPLEEPVVGGVAVHLDLHIALPAHLGLGAEPLSGPGEARLVAALEDGAELDAVR